MKAFGIILIVAGILSFAFPYITFTKKEKILDIGPIEATKVEKHTIPIYPLVGIVAVIGGVAVLMVAKKSA